MSPVLLVPMLKLLLQSIKAVLSVRICKSYQSQSTLNNLRTLYLNIVDFIFVAQFFLLYCSGLFYT